MLYCCVFVFLFYCIKLNAALYCIVVLLNFCFIILLRYCRIDTLKLYKLDVFVMKNIRITISTQLVVIAFTIFLIIPIVLIKMLNCHYVQRVKNIVKLLLPDVMKTYTIKTTIKNKFSNSFYGIRYTTYTFI